MKCKYCKYWKLEDELPGISEFMECRRIDENDPDWWKKWHFRGPDDSCEYGEWEENMMDDLISRKAAIDQAMGKFDYTDLIFDRATESEIVFMLRSLPSVPAVLLDKLCEFLEKCGADAYCGTCKQIMGECFTDGRGCGSAYFWKELLTKWMEGLDAVDKR